MGGNRAQAAAIQTLVLRAPRYEDPRISDHARNKAADGAPHVPLGGH